MNADRAWENFEENQADFLEALKVFSAISKPPAGSELELLAHAAMGYKNQNAGSDSELNLAVKMLRKKLNQNDKVKGQKI